MANKAGIINADTGVIVGVPDALVQVGGVWTIAATAPGTVPASRQINTTAPLTGGGDLSADRTLAIAAATAGNDGYMTTTQVATLATAASTAGAALPKAGGTMTGAIDMGSQKITSLGTPTATTDAATKGYVDTAVVGLLDLKGSIDCSASPNYPAALKGDVWVISVAGLIGGASGISVQAGDAILALADNAGGTQAAVGSSWSILQANLVGALLAANNLSDVGNTATARTNLGLGTAATANSTDFVARAGDTMTGALGINRGGGVINATDLHIGEGNILIDGAVSTRLEPVIAAPGNFPRTLTFHPKYTGNTGNNAVGLQVLPEVGVGASMPSLIGIVSSFQGTATKWTGIYVASGGGTATTKYDAIFNAGGNVGLGTDTPISKLEVVGESRTNAIGINRAGGTINAADLHIGAGSISIDGACSTRVEPVVASPGNYPRTLVFHPKYTGNVNNNAISMLVYPEIGAGVSMPLLVGNAVMFAGTATKWIGLWVLDGGGTATTKYDAIFNGGGNVGMGTDTPTAKLHISGTTKLGTSGTALSQVVVHTPSLTPAAVSAGAPAEQTFTVTGLATTDTVTVNAPGAAVFNARVSAANTLAITFMPPSAGSYTPPAGTYRIVAIRS